MSKPRPEISKDQQLLEALHMQGNEALEQLYLAYREDFIAFAQKYQAESDDILDAYQDAIIALYENVRTKKLTSMTSSVKTYLFSIGKFKLIDKLKAKRKFMQNEVWKEEEQEITNAYLSQVELNDRQQKLRQAINQLGGQCKELLILFYYRRYSIEAIKYELGFKNKNTVKANKSRCMKSLKTIIQQKGLNSF